MKSNQCPPLQPKKSSALYSLRKSATADSCIDNSIPNKDRYCFHYISKSNHNILRLTTRKCQNNRHQIWQTIKDDILPKKNPKNNGKISLNESTEYCTIMKRYNSLQKKSLSSFYIFSTDMNTLLLTVAEAALKNITWLPSSSHCFEAGQMSIELALFWAEDFAQEVMPKLINFLCCQCWLLSRRGCVSMWLGVGVAWGEGSIGSCCSLLFQLTWLAGWMYRSP